jgi:hypothetical protein
MDFDWADQLPAAVTICNIEGIILYMNNLSASIFSKDGGRNLIGKTLFDCHPEPAKSKLDDLLHNPRVNIYSIEKKGIKKMIYQAPWYRDGQFAGLVEISFPIPDEIPHFVRQ